MPKSIPNVYNSIFNAPINSHIAVNSHTKFIQNLKHVPNHFADRRQLRVITKAPYHYKVEARASALRSVFERSRERTFENRKKNKLKLHRQLVWPNEESDLTYTKGTLHTNKPNHESRLWRVILFGSFKSLFYFWTQNRWLPFCKIRRKKKLVREYDATERKLV